VSSAASSSSAAEDIQLVADETTSFLHQVSEPPMNDDADEDTQLAELPPHPDDEHRMLCGTDDTDGLDGEDAFEDAEDEEDEDEGDFQAGVVLDAAT
jgi:hypothetical protein